jgi:outer membrane protein assembly factor BamD (BamD/ComL family)
MLKVMQSGHYDESIILMLIQTYTQLGEKKQAITLARQMLNEFPGNSQLQSVLQETANMPK